MANDKKKKNIKIRYIPVNEDGQLDLNQLESLINKKQSYAQSFPCQIFLGQLMI